MAAAGVNLTTTPSMAPPDGQVPVFGGPWTSLQNGAVIAFGVSFFPATVAVVLRYIQQIKFTRRMEIDLGIITLSWLLAIAYFVITVKAIELGGWGRHLWNVSLAETMELSVLLLPNLLTYLCCTALTKLSLLVVLFHINSALMYRLSVVLVAIVIVAYTATFCAITGGPCKPSKPDAIPCLGKMVKAQAVLNIVADVAIIVVPLPTLWKLNLGLKQKLTISGLLALGSGVFICSVVRLPYVLDFKATSDLSWTEAVLGIWSTVEVNLGITLASAMRLKPILSRYFPGFEWTAKSSNNTNNNNKKMGSWGPNLVNKSKGQHSYQLHSVQKSSNKPHSQVGNGIQVYNSYSVDVRDTKTDGDSTDEILH